MKQLDLPNSVISRAKLGDPAALERVASHYERYLKRVTKLYGRPGRSEFDDSLGVARLAFARALQFYDPEKSDSFAGYMRVLVTRDLQTYNNKIRRAHDARIFLDDDADLEDCSPPVFDAYPSLSRFSELADSIDPLLGAVFTRLQSGSDFALTCREIGIQPKLARDILAHSLGRSQNEIIYISVSLGPTVTVQPPLMDSGEFVCVRGRAKFSRPRRRKTAATQLRLFEVDE